MWCVLWRWLGGWGTGKVWGLRRWEQGWGCGASAPVLGSAGRVWQQCWPWHCWLCCVTAAPILWGPPALLCSFPVKRDVQENDEEAVQVKEQSILELGSLLAKTGQAEGEGGWERWSWGLRLVPVVSVLGFGAFGARRTSWSGGCSTEPSAELGEEGGRESCWALMKLSDGWDRVGGGEDTRCCARSTSARRC